MRGSFDGTVTSAVTCTCPTPAHRFWYIVVENRGGAPREAQTSEVVGRQKGALTVKEQVRSGVRVQMVVSVALEMVPQGVTDCWQRRCPWLRGPELGPVIQRVDQFGRQLDVIAHYLLVLGNAIDVAHTPGQVSVHTWAQLTLTELQGR